MHRFFPSAAGLLLLAMLAPGPQGVAQTLGYQVTIEPTGAEAIDTTVREAAALVTLRETGSVGPFALVARALGDRARLADVLHSFGYYDAAIAITLDGRDLDDPALPALLEARPDGAAIAVRVAITPGPVFTIGRISVTGDVAADAAGRLGLLPGAPAEAAAVLAGQQRLLAALRAEGHALARVDPPVATLDPAAHALDLAFTVQAGPRVALGAIAFTGLEHVNEEFARRRLGLRPGEPFDPARIATARTELAASGVFAAVVIDPGTALDPAGRLPLTVRVTERPRRVVDLGASFSTDQGGSLSASWSHRNLWGNAEQLTLSAAATQLGGTASDQPGYGIGGTLKFPDWLARDQTLALNASALREYLRAYDRTGFVLGATVSRRLNPRLTVSLGAGWTAEEVLQEGVTRDYLLLQLPLTATYDSTDGLLDPTKGLRATTSLTPTASFGNAGQQNFLIAQASASAYFDFGSKGRSVLALRGLVGVIAGASAFDVAPDQRFYAGGGGTVRGFRFQSLGPQFPSNRPVGGTAVDAGSIEFRQRIGADWGAVLFVDAGQVAAAGVPFNGPVNVGAGLGVRYFTAIGPLRADIAMPVTRTRKGDAFELYIGIGHAF